MIGKPFQSLPFVHVQNKNKISFILRLSKLSLLVKSLVLQLIYFPQKYLGFGSRRLVTALTDPIPQH